MLLVGKQLINNEQREIMILEKVKGKSFRKVIDEKHLNKNEIAQVLEQAGTLLKRIHSVKVNGY